MTLITYVTRVHFADGILEEALRAELEVNHKVKPLLILEAASDHMSVEMRERLLASLPLSSDVEIVEQSNAIPTEEVAASISERYHTAQCDMLIAFGCNTIIDAAKIARVVIAHGEPLSHFALAEGGSRRIGEKTLPDLYAIPSILGFCSAVSAHAKVIQSNGKHARLLCRKLVPTVTICDPTLTGHVGRSVTASAGVDAIVHCLEAYLSPNYNPPADGIAFDGLRRAVEYLPKVLTRDQAVHRREMMAASLNSSLALQKGLGTTQVISDGLEMALGKSLDLGGIRRVMLPKVLRAFPHKNAEKERSLQQIMRRQTCGAEEVADFVETLEAYLADLPLPDRLGDFGVESEHLSSAAEFAAAEMCVAPGIQAIDSSRLERLMESVQ